MLLGLFQIDPSLADKTPESRTQLFGGPTKAC